MINEIRYAVKFSNGNYFRGGMVDCETEDLKYAVLFDFDWQVVKDLYLQVYLEDSQSTYSLIKIKTVYQIVE